MWTGKRASSKPASWNCLLHFWRLGCRRERRWSNYSRPSRASTGSTHVKKRPKNMRALCAPSAGETPRCDLCRQSPDERLATATALLAMLDSASECHGGEEAMDAFLRLGGPSILRFRLDSMDGLVQCLITARAPCVCLSVPLFLCLFGCGACAPIHNPIAVAANKPASSHFCNHPSGPCRRLDGGAEKRCYINA